MPADTGSWRRLPVDEECQHPILQLGGEPHHKTPHQVSNKFQLDQRTEAVQQQGLFASHWNDKLHSARTCGHLIKLFRYTPSRSRPNSISKNYLGQEELLGGCWRGDHPRRQQPRDHRPRGEPSEQKDLRWVVATVRLRHPCPHSSVSENSRRLGRFIHLTSVFQSVSETFSIHVHLIRGWPFHTKSSISDN